MDILNTSLTGLIRHFTSMWQKAFILPIGVAILTLSLVEAIEYRFDYARLIAPTALVIGTLGPDIDKPISVHTLYA